MLQVTVVFHVAAGYSCIAGNDGGETRATGHLTVHTPPVFLQKPTSKTVSKDRLVVFRCVVEGKPPPTIYWSKVQVTPIPAAVSTAESYKRYGAYLHT